MHFGLVYCAAWALLGCVVCKMLLQWLVIIDLVAASRKMAEPGVTAVAALPHMQATAHVA